MNLSGISTDFLGNWTLRREQTVRIGCPEQAVDCDYGTRERIELDGRLQTLTYDGQVDEFVQQSVGDRIRSAQQLEPVLRSAEQLLAGRDSLQTVDLLNDGTQWSASQVQNGLSFRPEGPDHDRTEIVVQSDQQVLVCLESPTERSDTGLRYSLVAKLGAKGVECREESLEVLDTIQSLISTSTLPVSSYGSLEAKPFSDSLKAGLKKADFNGRRVVFRRIGEERFTKLMKTGSDRDAHSHLFDLRPCDSDAATRALHGIEDGQATYAHELDLSGDTIKFLNPPLPGTLDELIEPLRASDTPWIFVAWDADKVQRAPNAQVEYWLPKDPKDAVALVMVPEQFMPRS